jgi:hypothetical protein
VRDEMSKADDFVSSSYRAPKDQKRFQLFVAALTSCEVDVARVMRDCGVRGWISFHEDGKDARVQRARAIVYVELRKQGLSYPEIAKLFQLKSHASVLRTVQRAMFLTPELLMQLKELREFLERVDLRDPVVEAFVRNAYEAMVAVSIDRDPYARETSPYARARK